MTQIGEDKVKIEAQKKVKFLFVRLHNLVVLPSRHNFELKNCVCSFKNKIEVTELVL